MPTTEEKTVLHELLNQNSPDQSGYESASTLEKRKEILIDALKLALTNEGEHRLFRSGRLAGLFPSKHGDSGEAAKQALAAGLLAHTRTESRGNFHFDWVKPTTKAAIYVADHDSPKAILRELRDVLGETKAGIPDWMERTRSELRALSNHFEQRAKDMLDRLDSLAFRVEDALRRAEAKLPGKAMEQGRQGQSLAISWADTALRYIDQRKDAGFRSCPLAELFEAVSRHTSDLSIVSFHEGIKRLAIVKALFLVQSNSVSPEFAVVYDGKFYQAVSRDQE